ncbi:MAG: hypothetical protein WCS31_06990 [Verrucomicrobiae bacterium]
MSRPLHPGVKWGCLVPIVPILIAIVGVVLLNRFTPSAPRSKLPPSATDIQEYYSVSGNGDFVRLIKAKMPQQEYPEYARRLQLVTIFDPATHRNLESMINIGIGGAPPWWNPPKASKTTYFENNKSDYLQVLSYSNGYVYYLVASW